MDSTTSNKDATGQGAEPHELFFVEHNRDLASAQDSIIFLHGAFGSHREWDHVVKHLVATTDQQQKQYHIIISDQLGHARSRDSSADTRKLCGPCLSRARRRSHPRRCG